MISTWLQLAQVYSTNETDEGHKLELSMSMDKLYVDQSLLPHTEI